MLRDIKMAPNSAATSVPPAVKFLAFEKWSSDVPVYPSTTKRSHEEEPEGKNEPAPEVPIGNLHGMWGSKWRVNWSVPVDVDLKIDYEGRLSTSLATGGSLYVSMRNLVVEGELWVFLDSTVDGMKAVLIHFEETPSVTYDLSGELRSSNSAAAKAKRALAWTAAQWTGKSEWDHAAAFVREKIVDKLIHDHTAGRAVRYRVGAPSESDRRGRDEPASQPAQHYQAGELFRTTTRNVNVVSSSPRTPPPSPRPGFVDESTSSSSLFTL
eukprot:COSAG02_NODE_68_length_42582_cov_52.351129_26_plen_268_part_00